jgi:tRNA U34 5-methylaminomethyl-2-thiouridine-forming methyltransferase MnmC
MLSPHRTIQLTTDGSHTVAIPSLDITYHSRHGAINESLHVFIEAGLNYWLQQHNTKAVRIFEMGFGTGLNALVTYIEAAKNNLNIYYSSVEQFPLEKEIVASLNYCETLERPDLAELFSTMHSTVWDEDVQLSPFFNLHKIQTSLQELEPKGKYDIVYYDAFAPNAQPELWTVEVFKKLFDALNEGGILVTYCSKGDVRRALIAAGFNVAKIPGPPYKREMLRAVKLAH